MMNMIRLIFSVLIIFETLIPRLAFAITTKPPPFNLSLFNQPSVFFKDVLDAISVERKWNNQDVEVTNLEKAEYAILISYNVSLHLAPPSEVMLEWNDNEVSEWKKFGDTGGDFESLVDDLSPKGVIDEFEIQGPFELLASADHRFQLMLPMNSSHAGLKRILVSEGITVKVKSALQVSMFNTYLSHRENGSAISNKKREKTWSLGNSVCMSLLPINIVGSASLVAYMTRNPDAHIEFNFLLGETIELLPEKYYIGHTCRKHGCLIDSFKSRIVFLEEMLQSILSEEISQDSGSGVFLEQVRQSLISDDISQNSGSGFFRGKVRASTVFGFHLELKRDIRSNDTLWTKLTGWSTRPKVEHLTFKIVAKYEAKKLKLLMMKKVGPFDGVDTYPWNTLMSSISFKKYPLCLNLH